MDANLLFRQLNEDFEKKIKEIRKEAYEQGYEDRELQLPLRTDFNGDINKSLIPNPKDVKNIKEALAISVSQHWNGNEEQLQKVVDIQKIWDALRKLEPVYGAVIDIDIKSYDKEKDDYFVCIKAKIIKSKWSVNKKDVIASDYFYYFDIQNHKMVANEITKQIKKGSA